MTSKKHTTRDTQTHRDKNIPKNLQNFGLYGQVVPIQYRWRRKVWGHLSNSDLSGKWPLKVIFQTNLSWTGQYSSHPWNHSPKSSSHITSAWSHLPPSTHYDSANQLIIFTLSVSKSSQSQIFLITNFTGYTPKNSLSPAFSFFLST